MLNQLREALGNDPGLVAGVILGTAGMMTGILISLGYVIMTNWRRVRQTEDENALKQAMLEQGLSADEIDRVVRATSLRGGRRHGPAISIAYNEGQKKRSSEAS